MKGQNMPSEVFRRSWLMLIPEWGLAGFVSCAVGFAAQYFDMQGDWEGLSFTVLPIVWAASRTLKWACQTWTVTADGHLIVREGLLLHKSREINLHSVQQVMVETSPLTGWLDIGNISCLISDVSGQAQLLRWTWLSRHRRLRDILQARGQLAVGGPPRRQLTRNAIRRLKYRGGKWLHRGRALTEEGLVRLQGRWVVDDYGRFLGFCHFLLRSRANGHWPPPRVPSVAVNRWMAILRKAHIVVGMPGGGWRVNNGIHSVEDIRQRIGEQDLQRALQH